MKMKDLLLKVLNISYFKGVVQAVKRVLKSKNKADAAKADAVVRAAMTLQPDAMHLTGDESTNQGTTQSPVLAMATKQVTLPEHFTHANLIPSAELSKKCRDRIVAVRTRLVMEMPFFGILSARLQLVENNTWCRTLAVDGRHLYYNTEFIMGVTDPARIEFLRFMTKEALPGITDEQLDEAVTVKGLSDRNLSAAICHEILHCAYNHMLRRGGRDPKLYNCAADYAINQLIVREKRIGDIQETWLYDQRFDGMSAEEIYNILLKERDENGEGEDGDSGEGGGSGSSMDQHLDPDDDDDDENGNGKKGGKDGKPTMARGTMQEYMDEFQNAMTSAASAKGTPEEIKRLVKEMNESKIDWRSKLPRTLLSLIKNDASFSHPSRRSWNLGVILPGMKPDDTIDICIALDTSGSIHDDMLRDFLSEVVAITKMYSQFRIKLLCFDHRIHSPETFSETNVGELLKYELAGGGGTDFEQIWAWMKEEDYQPELLLMFTDGMPCGGWGDPDYCRALFVIHTYDVEPPFGDHVKYEYEPKK